MENPPPPPPPPHGEGRPKRGGLPDGNYDIFIIPPHMAGGGFLYLPSLRPSVNSFAAGFATALFLVFLYTITAPAFVAWWHSVKGQGGVMVLIMVAIGVGAWSLGRTQVEGGGADGASGSRPPPSGHGQSNGHPAGGTHMPGGGAGPMPGAGGFPGAGSMPRGAPGADKPKPNASWQRPPEPQPNTSWQRPTSPETPPPPRSQAPPPPRPTPQPQAAPPPPRAAPPPKPPSTAWERSKEETKRKEEERKAKEEERKAAEAAQKKKEEDDRKRKELVEKMKQAREKDKAEREAREKKEKEAADIKSRGSSYAFPTVGEKTSLWPGGRPPAPASQPSTPKTSPVKPTASPSPSPTKPSPIPSPTKPFPKRPPPPTAHTYQESEEDAYSYRPYDKPKPHPLHRRPSQSSFFSESSYAASQSTSRTTPPPSQRGKYTNKDPDKIIIKAVYSFNNSFIKTPSSQLVSGVGSVTDGLILRITTEGLFIDDDVRGVAQREWDVKAWTLKLVEQGKWEARGLHLLRASIRDAEGKRFLFVLARDELWKVVEGLARLRKGSQVRALGLVGMSDNEAKNTLEGLGWG